MCLVLKRSIKIKIIDVGIAFLYYYLTYVFPIAHSCVWLLLKYIVEIDSNRVSFTVKKTLCALVHLFLSDSFLKIVLALYNELINDWQIIA